MYLLDTGTAQKYYQFCRMSHFVSLETIGISVLGRTCIAQDITSKNYFAIKIIRKDFIGTAGARDMLKNLLISLRALTSAKSSFIPNILRIAHDENFIHIITPFYSGGGIVNLYPVPLYLS